MYINSNQVENSLPIHDMKDTYSYSNTYVSMNSMNNRAFGRDISNIRNDDPKSSVPVMQKQELQSYLSSASTNASEFRGTESHRDTIDLSSAELPKTTRDPLIASRELLSLKQNQDKPSLKYETQSSKRFQKIPMNLFAMENCDILEINNPQFVSGYAKEIFDYLLTAEEKYTPKSGYLVVSQNDITEKMRGILIDWLVDIHIKFKLQQETLYLAINVLDRALSKISVSKQKLQLMGITSMFIAAKYQEIYPPEVKDFVYVADKTYPKEEILEMEGRIICHLNFNITVPSALTFLERYSRLAGLDQKSFFFCQYLIELAQLDYKLLKYKPSLLACGAVQLTSKIFKRRGCDDALVRNSNYTSEQILLCAKDLLSLVRSSEKSSLKAVRRKFLSSNFMEVAKIQIDIA